MKLFFPDCLWNPGQISGAIFLFFYKEKIGLTLHPSVSSYLSGVDASTFLPFLEEKAPIWKKSFLDFSEMWHMFRSSLFKTHNLIEPLHSDSFITIMLSYGRGTNAWNDANDLLESSTFSLNEITSLIDPFHACDELYSHLFFEKILETRYGELTNTKLTEIGKKQAQSIKSSDDLIKDFDWTPIFEYCCDLFSNNTLSELLVRSYLFRVPFLNDIPTVLLSNQNLIKLLGSMPVSGIKDDHFNSALETDVIAWEFFRQLISPVLDPLDTSKIELLGEMISERQEEIERLKNKCYELSENLSAEKNIEKLIPRVNDMVKARVLNDLDELLKMDAKAFSRLLTQIFSDEKAWMAISTFILSLLKGGEVVTAGAAIYSLSNVGAKAFKEAAIRREKLANSPYTLIYRMNK